MIGDRTAYCITPQESLYHCFVHKTHIPAAIMTDSSNNLPPLSDLIAEQLTTFLDPNSTLVHSHEADAASGAAGSNILQDEYDQTAEQIGAGGTTNRQPSESSESQKLDMLAKAQEFAESVTQNSQFAPHTVPAAVPLELSETVLTTTLDYIVQKMSVFEGMADEDVIGTMVSRLSTLQDPVKQRCHRYRGGNGRWLDDKTEVRLIAAIVAVCETPPTEKTYEAIFERVEKTRK